MTNALCCRIYVCTGEVASYTDTYCEENGPIDGCYLVEGHVQYKSCGVLLNGSKVSFETNQKGEQLCLGILPVYSITTTCSAY